MIETPRFESMADAINFSADRLEAVGYTYEEEDSVEHKLAESFFFSAEVGSDADLHLASFLAARGEDPLDWGLPALDDSPPKIDLYEDDAGRLMIVAGPIAIRVAQTGDFLDDCRLYGESWSAEDQHKDDLEGASYPRSRGYELVATWHRNRKALGEVEVHRDPDSGFVIAGGAAREYLGDLIAEDE